MVLKLKNIINLFNYLRNIKIQSNWLRRTLVGIFLTTSMSYAIYNGPIPIIFIVLGIQIKCFDEIMTIAYNENNLINSKNFCLIKWYFVLSSNYFLSIEFFAPHFKEILQNSPILNMLITYHRFISFCLHFIGIVLFLRNLKRGSGLRNQFSMLASTHFLIIAIIFQSYLALQNMFEGFIWFIMPVALVTLNDIFAYFFGRMIGKTPLIQVSAKKTIEGFICGLIGTFLVGTLLGWCICKFNYLTCPMKVIIDDNNVEISINCVPSYLFTETNYYLGDTQFYIRTYPYVWHSLVMSFFASIVAPFGGFCASGFKRAFNVKDFGSLIPGHGGIMDRCDCQFLMMTFVHVYLNGFINVPNIDSILTKILYLSESNQLKFYKSLEEILQKQNPLFNITN